MSMLVSANCEVHWVSGGRQLNSNWMHTSGVTDNRAGC